ncbi:MAG: hypothetical protein IPL83_14690 [Bdellovibrionales bacterium]|nr:hypothetical protein [Bdellovibrionales bacterium]
MKNRRIFAIHLVTILLLISGSIFNSCSDINFSGAQFTNTDPDQPGTGLGDRTCRGKECEPCYESFSADCGDPKVPVPHETSYTVPSSSSKVDILAVIDNSGSMEQEHQKLSDRLENLIDVLNAAAIDWQICYTLTHVTNRRNEVLSDAGAIHDWFKRKANNNREFESTGLRILGKDTPNSKQIFSDTLDTIGVFDSGSGNGSEQAVAAARYAVERQSNDICFRSDAALAMITVTDEDERSCGGRCQITPDEFVPFPGRPLIDYTGQYRPLTDMDNPEKLIKDIQIKWPGKPFTAHSISILRGDKACYDQQDKDHPAFYGYVYQSLSDLTDGIKGNICSNDYSSQLTSMGERTVKSLNALTLECAPQSVEQITIDPNNGNTWTLSGDKIYFNPPLTEGTRVLIKYTCLE